MGTFGRIGVGSRGLMAYGEERLWGDPVPPPYLFDFTSESLVNEIGNLISDAIDPSRGVKKRVLGTSAIGGDANFEQSTEGYEVFYKHGFGDAITLYRCDGGVRTQTTQDHAAGVTTLNVGDTTDFDSGGGNWDLVVVYKDGNGILQAEEVVYSAKGGTTFTVTATTNAFPQGAWVFQINDGTDAYWDDVYTHYIEAAAELPAGMTIEAGRDIAHFIYTGMKVDTIENTFNAQEILTGTFGLAGKAEVVGGDLSAGVSAGATTFTLTNYTTSGSVAIEAASYWSENGVAASDTCTTSGTYTGSVDKEFIVRIFANGTPDTFEWSDDGGRTWNDNTGAGYPITAGPDSVGTEGVQVTFGTTTTHVIGESWTFRATVEHIVGFDPSGGTVQMGTENDITYTGYTVSTGVFTGVPASGDGAITIAHAADQPVVPQQTWQSNTHDAPTVDPLTSFQAGVYIDGSFQEVLSGNFTLNNNHNTDKFQLGDRYRAGLPEQRRTVEGTLNVEFDDVILYRKFINGTPAFLEFRCVDESELIGTDGTTTTYDVYRQKHVIFPNIEFTGTTPNVEGEEMITHDMNFTALRDVDNNMNEVAVIFVNTRQMYF